METLDDYIESHGRYHLRIEEKSTYGIFEAKIKCLRDIGHVMAWGNEIESDEPYVQLLRESKLERSLAKLTRYLKHENYGAYITKEKALGILVDYVENKGPYSDIAVMALGEIGDKKARPAIAQSLSSYSVNKWWGVKALSKVGYKGVEDLVVDYLKKEHRPASVRNSLWILRKSKTKEADYILEKYQRDMQRKETLKLIKSWIRLEPVFEVLKNHTIKLGGR